MPTTDIRLGRARSILFANAENEFAEFLLEFGIQPKLRSEHGGWKQIKKLAIPAHASTSQVSSDGSESGAAIRNN